MARVRVAVIGVGQLGKEHARVFHAIPDAELVTVVDVDAERAKSISAKHGVAWQTDLKNLRDRIDAASVAVPTRQHFAVASALLRQGSAVMLEKPMTDNPAHAEELDDIARRVGVPLQVGHIERFNPAFVAASAASHGVQPFFIECERLAPFSFRSTDVGVVLDLMIHDIDIVHHLVGSELKRVDAIGFDAVTTHEDIANARLTFRNGCVANLSASRISLKSLRKLRVFSTAYYLSVDLMERKATVYRKSPELTVASLKARRDVAGLMELKSVPFRDLVCAEELKVEDYEPLRRELESFVECVRARTRPVVSGEDGLRAVRTATLIADEIRKGLRSIGRPPQAS